MGSNAVKTIINCGTTQVSLSVFSADGATLVLERHIVEDLHYDYSEVKTLWADAVIPALQNIFRSGVKPEGEIVMIVPGHMLMTHTLTMSHMPDPAKRASYLAYEAEKSFPFSLDMLVCGDLATWSDGIEEKVILFGLKRDAIVEFTNRLMSETKLVPTRFQPSTCLEAHAYRYLTMGQSDLPPTLLVNVGAHTTTLTFMTDCGYEIAQFAIGGNYITQKIAEATGTPFIAAENRKIAYFEGELQFAQDDPTAAAITAAADSFTRRIHREINLRLIGFRKNNNGVGPARVLISGRAARLPGFTEKLSSLLRLPIEPLDMRPLISLVPGVQPMDDCELQESVGEATMLVLPEITGVNLFPPEIAAKIEFKKKLPFLTIAGICFALFPLPIYFHFAEQGKNLNAELKAKKAEIQKLTETQEYLKTKSDEAARLTAFVDKLGSALSERFQWNDFLAGTQNVLEELHSIQVTDADGEKEFSADRHVWLDALKVNRKLVPAADGVPAKVVCDVDLTFAMLLPQVDADDPKHNQSVFDARRKVILDALKKAEFVDPSEPFRDKARFEPANLPTLTVTVRVKSEKGL